MCVYGCVCVSVCVGVYVRVCVCVCVCMCFCMYVVGVVSVILCAFSCLSVNSICCLDLLSDRVRLAEHVFYMFLLKV